MAIIKPFNGLRPIKEIAEKVASPPYDVLNSEEAREMAKGNPYSFLHINKPEIDLPPDTDPYADAVYEKGRENIQRFISEGTFVKDAKPCFYIYRQIMGAHSQYGLVCGASVDEYQKDGLGVDTVHDLLADLGLLQADGVHGGPELAVEVDQLESVGVGEVEGTYAHSRQRVHLGAAGAAESGDGHARTAKPILFRLAEKTDIACEGRGIIKLHRSSGCHLVPIRTP